MSRIDRERTARRRAEAGARRLLEAALRPGATTCDRSAAMREAVADGFVDPWLSRAAATIGDEAALAAGFLPFAPGEERWTREDERAARREGWLLTRDDDHYGIYVQESMSGGRDFEDRAVAEAWLRDRAAAGDGLAIKAFALVAAGVVPSGPQGNEIMLAMMPFNPAFAEWLNDRGATMADWLADDVSLEMRGSAFREFGLERGAASAWGWSEDEMPERSASEARRVVDGFMLRAPLGRRP